MAKRLRQKFASSLTRSTYFRQFTRSMQVLQIASKMHDEHEEMRHEESDNVCGFTVHKVGQNKQLA